jgi:integrase
VPDQGGPGFKGTKTDEPRVLKLEERRKKQDAFRAQFGPDYQADLDLVFANPDGSPLKPNSISATVSLLFKRFGIPKPKGESLRLLRHTMASQMLAGS